MPETAEKAFVRLENRVSSAFRRILRQVVLIEPTDRYKQIDLETPIRSAANNKRVRKEIALVMDTGIRYAYKGIDRALVKNTAAGAYAAADTQPDEDEVRQRANLLLAEWEDAAVNKYTEKTVEGMLFLARDAQDDLIETLRDGYYYGESIPKLRKRVQEVWNVTRPRAQRLARTMTNQVYNDAHHATYLTEPAVAAVQFDAHIDSRTSDICRMYNGTIWRKDDPAIQRPPLHFMCRSRLVVYVGGIPAERDYTKEFDQDEIDRVNKQVDTFKKKYWDFAKVDMPNAQFKGHLL